MKEFIIKLFAVAFIIFSNAVAFAQDRRVQWIHGLNNDGSDNIWRDRYANQFQTERHVISNIPDDPNTLTEGVRVFADHMSWGFMRDGSNIAVGHSMGGMALRDFDIRNPNQLRGIITAGAPLLGTDAATPKGINFDIFVAHAAYNAYAPWTVLGNTAGPSSNFSELLFFVGGARLFRERLQDFIGVPSGQTQNDLALNSNYNLQTGAIATPTPKIQIWGNEEYPAGVRLISTIYHRNDPANIPNDRMLNMINSYADFLYGQSVVATFFMPTRAYRCRESANYFKQGMNQEWSQLTGALQWKTVSYWTWVSHQVQTCQNVRETTWSNSCGGWIRWLCKTVEVVTNVFRCFFETVWSLVEYNTQMPVLTPSDGLVCDFSARADGQNWRVSPARLQWDMKEATGVNHMEMGDHPAMLNAFNEAWDGLGYPGYPGVNPSPFRMPRR